MVDSDPGTVGCWKPGRAYGAGGAIQAGNSPFTDADFLAYNAISGNDFVDHFNTLDAEWEEISHGDWGVTGGYLEHDGAESNSGNDPGRPQILARSDRDLDAPNVREDVSVHYEIQVVRGGATGHTNTLEMVGAFPANVAIMIDYDNDQFEWRFEAGGTPDTGGDPEETQQVLHIHMRRRNDPASGDEFLAGIFIGTLSAGTVSASLISHTASAIEAVTPENQYTWYMDLYIDRDSSAGNAAETGNFLYAKAHSKER